jgi:signal peptidase I
MEPTLLAGDQIVVTPYFGAAPDRGDIVVFRSPMNADELVVKRVIAVPGDLVDSRLGRVRVGGHTMDEPYVLREAASGAIESQIIGQDSYFVMGDNRDDSVDSRNWGALPRALIVGRARMVIGGIVHASGEASAQSARDARAMRPRRLFKWLG